jgi:chromate reductase, NAD(P)H dehydrogenase (quinone)
MKSIIALGASNSKNSINQALASYTAHQVKDAFVQVIDLNNYELPLYSVDQEGAIGIPENATKLSAAIAASDGIVLSLAEHNGSFTTAFKNTVDWMSRIDSKLWKDKPMLLLATSPGPRGAATVLESATNIYPHQGGQVIASFSLPSFYENFSEQGIKDEQLKAELDQKITLFQRSLA